MQPPAPDFLPTADLSTLQQRAKILTELRRFFADHGYWEVETPLLSRDCCVDVWIEPYAVPLGRGETGWLQTSPEFAMKRLLAAGAERIFQVCRAFRREESGPLHNPEFTMIEWYAVGTDHLQQMQLVEDLVRHLEDFVSRLTGHRHDESSGSPILRLTYEEAFRNYAGLSPSLADREELLTATTQHVPEESLVRADRDDLLNVLLGLRVEPELTRLRRVFLYDYPASQSALARVRPGCPPVAERFELYLNGIEICNGYHELTDADELRNRMTQRAAQRIAAGLPPIPAESRLLSAMTAGLPPCAGVALGFDRLVMRLLNQSDIRGVIPFPVDRA